MKRNILIIQLLLLLISGSVACDSKNIWDDFIYNPNETNFNRCEKQINESLSGGYEKFKSPTWIQITEDGIISKFLDLVEGGNIYANELCYQLFPLFRSHGYIHYLEFFDVALGKLIKKDAEAFLLLRNKYLKRPEGNYIHMDNLLCALGDDFVDEFDKQIKEIEERIEALKKVQEENLKELRDQCIEILVNHKNFIIKVKEELKDKEEQKK